MNRKKIYRYLWMFLSFVSLVTVWKITSIKLNNSLILPSPEKVLFSFYELSSKDEFHFALLSTFLCCVKAFLFSVLAGFITGYLCSINYCIDAFLEPVIVMIQSVPVVAVIMLAMFWLKSASIPFFVCVLMTCPLIINNVRTGFKKCDRRLLNICSCYGFSTFQKTLYVKGYGILPYLYSGVKSCISVTWKVVAAGEVLALPRLTLGRLMYRSQMILESQEVFAYALTIVLCSFLSGISLEFMIWLVKQLVIKGRILKLKRTIERMSVLDQDESSVSSSCNSNSADYEQLPDVSIKNLNVKYKEPVFQNFNVSFKGGIVSAIAGESGTGKTTLLDHIALMYLDKQSLVKNSRVSYMKQSGDLIEQLTVFENIYLPLKNIYGKSRAAVITQKYIKQTGLEDKSLQSVVSLSGGEKQRVSMARAFAYPSDILLMDEAFSNQDLVTKFKLMNCFKSLQKKEKRTVILVSHNLDEINTLAEEVYILKDRPVIIKKLNGEINAEDLQ